jgi:hypothetical protein
MLNVMLHMLVLYPQALCMFLNEVGNLDVSTHLKFECSQPFQYDNAVCVENEKMHNATSMEYVKDQMQLQ